MLRTSVPPGSLAQLSLPLARRALALLFGAPAGVRAFIAAASAAVPRLYRTMPPWKRAACPHADKPLVVGGLTLVHAGGHGRGLDGTPPLRQNQESKERHAEDT